jgi:hypothetical protein
MIYLELLLQLVLTGLKIEIMEYKEGYLENGELKFKNIKQIDQSTLTSDCWLI